MTTFARLLLTVVVAVTALAPLRGQGALDYPQWRGADRDGAASSFSEPASWPQTLRRRWQVDVGDGYATPIVIGSTVYAFSRRDGQEVLTALDAATGRERWRSAYEAPYTPSQPTVAHGSGPKATPLFLNGRVFTQGISGIVSAFEAATGKRLWQTREPSEHPFYSAASSPAGEGDSVYVHPANYEPLTAFDAASGRVRWTVGDGGFFMSPLIVSLEGTRQVVTVTQSAIIGVSIPDGRLLWRYPWPGANGGSMPVAYGDTIITSADAGVIALKPMRRGDSWTAETVWETKDVSMYLSNPVVIDDTLYGLSKRNSGQFFAIDARTGAVRWLGTPREAANTAVVKAPGVLFLLNDDGELIVARASAQRFQPLVRYAVSDAATWAQPAISGNRIFVKDTRTLALWTVD